MWITPSQRILIGALTVLTLWPAPWTTSSAPTVDVAEASLAPIATPSNFEFRTAADGQLTEWAFERFERAGLHLPPLTIAFHDDKEACNGQFGLHQSGPPSHIHICGLTWSRPLPYPKHTLLHELAHAWAAANLTEQTRGAFVFYRGLETWGDEQTPWEEKGSEHAAEIIAWALMDQDLLLTTIRDTEPSMLAEAYLLLTGTEPPSRARTPVTVMETVLP